MSAYPDKVIGAFPNTTFQTPIQTLPTPPNPNPNFPNNYIKGYFTPLTYAVQQYNKSDFVSLIQAGHNINELDKDGWAPLHYAVYYADVEFVKLILSHGADINQVNESEETALFNSIKHYDLEIFKLLIDSKASLRSKIDVPTSSILYHLKISSHPKAKEFFKYIKDQNRSIDIPCFQFVNHFFLTKLFTHILGIGNQIIYNGNVMSAEGFAPEAFTKHTSKSIHKFAATYPDLIDEKTAKGTIEGLRLITGMTTATQYLERIKNGKPTFLPSGFKNHHVIVLIWKKTFAVCNRGEASIEFSSRIGRIDPTKIDITTVNQIINLRDDKPIAFTQLLIDETQSALLKKLQFKRRLEKEIVYEYLADLPKQKFGHCSWNSLEATIKVYWTLSHSKQIDLANVDWENINEIKRTMNEKFSIYALFEKILLIQKYMKRGLDPKSISPDVFSTMKSEAKLLPKYFKHYLMETIEKIEGQY